MSNMENRKNIATPFHFTDSREIPRLLDDCDVHLAWVSCGSIKGSKAGREKNKDLKPLCRSSSL